MNAITTPQRPPQTSLQLSDLARAALDRIKTIHGVNKVKAVESGIFLYESRLNQGSPAIGITTQRKGRK